MNEIEVKVVPRRLEMISDIEDFGKDMTATEVMSRRMTSEITKRIELDTMNSMGIPNRMVIHDDIKLSLPVYFGQRHSSIYSTFHDESKFDKSFVNDSNNMTVELAVKHFFERLSGLTLPFILERKNPAKQSAIPYYCPWSNLVQEMDDTPTDEIAFSFSVYDYSINIPTNQFPWSIQFKIAINNNPTERFHRINDLERLFISSNYYMVMSGEMDIEEFHLINSVRINRLLMVNPHSSRNPRIIINSREDHDRILQMAIIEERLRRDNIL